MSDMSTLSMLYYLRKSRIYKADGLKIERIAIGARASSKHFTFTLLTCVMTVIFTQHDISFVGFIFIQHEIQR